LDRRALQNAKPGDDVPVVVFFFGGMFMTGSNVREGPHYFMNHRIIFVQPNFRLGLLGYASTGDEVISGNMGYKDQTMAIKWTKENIRAFGGNPDMITLYGHSTGAIGCMFHAFSPLSKGE
jgi:carboxylesterase type B